MSVKRRELIDYFKANGFRLIREGGKHSIYSNGIKTVIRSSAIARLTG